ncbi:SOSS complex subunit B family protein [Halococcus thailandensis]|jgi:hypothetical protein|uniref:SOSS complex subunit B family protein n=1 Tax=Halococcus thailandensis TaxID=335952 RepID=UPI0012685306|nr:SOSS complex subunit B family protein [Halococcus thailandensis]
MSSKNSSGKTVSVAQDEIENGVDAEAGAERCATRFRERGNEGTSGHVTIEDTFTAPTSVTQREGESGVGRDNIALDVREDDEGGVTNSIAGQLGNADELMSKVGTSDGQAIVSDKQRELDAETEQGENVVYMGDFDFAETGDDPYDWTCAIDEENRTLEQEERAAGVEAEFDRFHEQAHAAHERGEEPGRANAAANRRLARSWVPDPRGTTVEEVQEEMEPRVDPEAFVKEQVPEALIEEVREEARRLSEKYELSGPEWTVAKHIVERVGDGTDFDMAVFAEREAIKNRWPMEGQVTEWNEYGKNRRVVSGQRQFIEDINPMQDVTTIEGEVVTLWDPKDPAGQQQVGLVDDGTGECKVTVWQSSYKDTILHEGDTVRIIDGEPDQYNGRPTVAVSGRTKMCVLSHGDGPAPRGTQWYDSPKFDVPMMTEIHRRRTYRHRNPERGLSANPNKEYAKGGQTIGVEDTIDSK